MQFSVNSIVKNNYLNTVLFNWLKFLYFNKNFQMVADVGIEPNEWFLTEAYETSDFDL